MVNRNPQSTAQIAGHPLHPMLIPFPVAFLVATLVSSASSRKRSTLGLERRSVISPGVHARGTHQRGDRACTSASEQREMTAALPPFWSMMI